MCVSFRTNLKGLSEQSRGLCEWPVKLHPPSTAASLGVLSRLIRMEGTIINYKILSTKMSLLTCLDSLDQIFKGKL